MFALIYILVAKGILWPRPMEKIAYEMRVIIPNKCIN